MDVLEAIQGRASVRAFLDKPVPMETVRQILDTARWAPSSVNAQPWIVHVVVGPAKSRLANAMIEAHRSGLKPALDYNSYPAKLPEPYRSRRYQCGMALYNAAGISRGDQAKREAMWLDNYHSFGAPVQMYFFLEKVLEQGAWLDMGMFLQNIMVAARAFGLDTCPQVSLAAYPDVVRQLLDVSDRWLLVCGMALGHADQDHPVNQYRTEREPVDQFTSWHGEK